MSSTYIPQDFVNTALATQDISNQIFDSALGLNPSSYSVANTSDNLLSTASNLGTSVVSSASSAWSQYQTPLIIGIIALLGFVALTDIKPRGRS